MSKKNRFPKRTSNEPTHEEVKPKDKSPYVHQREKLKHPLNINMRYELNEKQKAFVEKGLDKNTRLILCDGLWGSAKAQPLDAKILTPAGWRLMGDLKQGDVICAADGGTTVVKGIFPQGEKEIYRIIFSDGSSTECCLDHLWLTQTEFERNRHRRARNGGKPIYTKAPINPKARSLAEIKDTLYTRNGHLNHSIPMVKPLMFPKREHHIHPYILGVLLGDGCLIQHVHFTSADSEIANRVNELLPPTLKVNHPSKIEYSICRSDGRKGIYGPNSFKRELERLNLWGNKSTTKFVPEEYLIDSIENRIELLRGLMDTDGTTNGVYTSFSTTSSSLAYAVQFLVQSLGGTGVCTMSPPSTYTYHNKKLLGQASYRVGIKLPNDINPFYLARKKDKVKPRTKYFPVRYFESIEPVGKKAAQCILVDNADHLYITDNVIVTHNTYLSVYVALQLLSDKRVDSIIYLRAPVEAGKSIGFLPGGSDEKINPYAEPLFQKLHELLDEASIKMLEADKRIEVVPPGFMRGQSWNCKAIIVDEAANFDRAMLELILSRVGPFCKVFVVGSQHQSDIHDAHGFMSLFSAFDDEQSKEHGIHCFYFNEESDIVRSHFIKFVMRKLGILKTPQTVNKEGDWYPSGG